MTGEESCFSTFHPPLCAQLQMTVAPYAAAGIARAYPIGCPTILPMADTPHAPCPGARYLLRQTFIAEIPITIGSHIQVSKPHVRPIGCTSVCNCAPKED